MTQTPPRLRPSSMGRPGHRPAPPASFEERIAKILLTDETGQGFNTEQISDRFDSYDGSDVINALERMLHDGRVICRWVKPRGRQGRRWWAGPSLFPETTPE